MSKGLILCLSIALLLSAGCRNHQAVDNKKEARTDTNTVVLRNPLISSNLLDYQAKEYFQERRTISTSPTFRFIQELRYDIPEGSDEEFWFKLEINLTDTALAKSKGLLNLKIDSSVVNYMFNYGSAWATIKKTDPGCKVIGQIEILEWSNNKITLKEDLSIPNFMWFGGAKYYTGIRTFVREKKKHHNHKER